VPDTINPVHWQVINTFAEPAGITIERVGHDQKSMLLDLADLRSKLDNQVAGVYIENPSYLGFIEPQVDEISQVVHDAGSLLVVGVDVLSLGILRPPGNYGADIVVGEGQCLGSTVSFGGPYLGVFGCKDDMKIIRQLPGRLVGMTRTSNEPYERGFVLTLVPREQHIRREKATSNICSNQALIAVTAAVYTSTLGPEGFRHLGEVIAYKSHYAAKQLNKISGVTAPAFGVSFWKEFVMRFEGDVSARMVHESLLKHDLHGGKILTEEYPEFGESMLLCVTELNSKTAIDELVEVVRDVVTNGGGTR
jgi:glycine dehydrogenase subunit 1